MMNNPNSSNSSTRTVTAAALILLLGLLGSPLMADMCSLDQEPAATLLLPYFEVDLDDPQGRTTIVTLQNAFPEATVVHATFWTDWSQPTISFDIFLTGFDVQVLNLRDAFDNGSLPVTADSSSDPTDTISPHGNNPEWDGAFGFCNAVFPYPDPVINNAAYEILVDGHTGHPVSAGQERCMGSNYGDNVARGYVTFDDVFDCSLSFPSDAHYFGGQNPVATDENQLFGDFLLVDPGDSEGLSHPLIHIQADPTFDASATPSGATFYGRFTAGGEDHREPLGSVWAAPFDIRKGSGTDFVVWRDSTSPDVSRFFDCGVGPAWVPLQTEPVSCWDLEENLAETCFDGSCFGLETQRTTVGLGAFQPSWEIGWCQLDLNVDPFAVPPTGAGINSQSWVGALQTNGTRSSGLVATLIASACEAPPASPNRLFGNGFESGTTSAWFLTAP